MAFIDYLIYINVMFSMKILFLDVILQEDSFSFFFLVCYIVKKNLILL